MIEGAEVDRMAFFQYLVFDGENLPLPDFYEMELDDVEADSGGETEAGTTQSDVAAWCCADPGVVFCYGEVACEAGKVCEAG